MAVVWQWGAVTVCVDVAIGTRLQVMLYMAVMTPSPILMSMTPHLVVWCSSRKWGFINGAFGAPLWEGGGLW